MREDDLGLKVGRLIFDIDNPFVVGIMTRQNQKASYVDDARTIIIPENWLEIRNENGEVGQFVPGFVDLENSNIQFALLKS